MSFFSQAYGLALLADGPIPGLDSRLEARAPDLEIRMSAAYPSLPTAGAAPEQLCYVSPCSEDNQPSIKVYCAPDRSWYRLHYSDDCEFLIDAQGRHISGTWPQPMTLDDAATYLLGPVIGFALRLRGITCLHASAVIMQGQAVVFLGDAGAGKSTTAALLAGAGHAALTDDIAALDDRGTTFFVQPGYPRLRLWPDSVQALYGSPEALPRITPTWDKRHLDLTPNFCNQPARLAVIYVLDNTGTAPVCIAAVSPHEALLGLVTHSTVNYLLDKSMRAREFDFLTRLVNQVPVRRLIYHPHSINGQLLSAALQDDLALH